MNAMSWIAVGVFLIVTASTLWALVRHPSGIVDLVFTMWERPWGKQVLLDFYGLEVILALFMVTHAMGTGTWLAVSVCLVLMPFLGASAAAAYWLIAVV